MLLKQDLEVYNPFYPQSSSLYYWKNVEIYENGKCISDTLINIFKIFICLRFVLKIAKDLQTMFFGRVYLAYCDCKLGIKLIANIK